MLTVTQNPDSGQDLDIIAAIREGAEISVCIPEDIPSPQLFSAIHECGRLISRTDRYGRALRFALGKMMTMAARRPGFLREAGFEKFAAFEDALIEATNLERSTLWKWKPIYEELPELTREQLSNISAEHFTLILKIPDHGRRTLALEAAPEMSYRAFQRFVEDQGFVGPGESEGASFILSGSKDEIAEARQFFENAAIQEFAGKRPIDIVLAALHETASAGWPTV
jgi:hypothetical protein